MHLPPSSRRAFLTATSAAAAGILSQRLFGAGTSEKVDVCIYGGTSGGVIAAVALAKLGRSVALVEPMKHLGGMTSGGLGWVDIKKGGIRAVGGLTRDYYDRIFKGYQAAGIDPKKCGNEGIVAEPHVAEKYLEELISEQKKNIRVYRETRLSAVKKDGRRLRAITCDKAPVDKRGAPGATPTEAGFVTIEAAMFIDCSYEGDLLAAAGVTHRMDREASSEYNESSAGVREFKGSKIDPYVKPGDPASGLLPLINKGEPQPLGVKSSALQAFNFRLCLVKENPMPIAPPANYDPRTYELLARWLAAQEKPVNPSEFHKGPWRLLKFSPLPRGKTDVNNAGFVSMDFVGFGSEKYAPANWAERQRMWHAHEDYQRGMLHFLVTDERVSEAIRTELKKWGLPRDEFKYSGGWPTQLYVREARRMVGDFVMKENDCVSPGKVTDPIALGAYSLDSHSCQRLAKDGEVVQEGGFLHTIPATYPIPYGAILPKETECENLLATFCVSSTHVSFSSIRMEPPFMAMSESAAIAANQALEDNKSVQAIDRAKFAKRLRDAGQVVESVG